MGLTKQYLRYKESSLFGIVASKNCNSTYLQPSRFVATGGTNSVIVWDIRLQRKVLTFNSSSPCVVLKPNHDSSLLAVGHLNGGVSLYDLKDKSEDASPDPNVTFEGHTSEVLTLDWDESGCSLLSGAKDARVILWDCIEESGVGKFIGHKGPITRVRFWKDSYAVSSSADSTVKFWNIRTQTCIHTIPGNKQIWDFCFWSDYIFIGERDVTLLKLSENSNDDLDFIRHEEIGSLSRLASDRVQNLTLVDSRFLLISGAKSSTLDIYVLNSSTVAEKRMRKRISKEPESSKAFILKDLLRQADSAKASEGKIKSVDALIDTTGALKILCGLSSNQLEIVTANPSQSLSKENIEKLSKKGEILGFDGHRTIVRALAISSDKTAILSASADAFIVWHRATIEEGKSGGAVLRIKHEFPVVCCKFCPGDRHFIGGTTCGNLILGDISKGQILQIEQSGHESVWGLDVFPNSSGFVSSNGKLLQFYEFSMSDGTLRFDLKREFNVNETILCVKVSLNMRFIAVGLLDSTIKVFYFDTLKFHLSMYGHSLPVVSLDISSDNYLLVSCSGDKTIKVWGMDFGDVHSSNLHSDGLVGVAFIENTHHVVSVAKDSLNFYDGDSKERIQTIKAHVDGGASCMSIGGQNIVTGGKDQSIRLFKKTDEILVLDDEREREREDELDAAANAEVPELPSLHTAESDKTADKLMEGLKIWSESQEEATTNSHTLLLAAYGVQSPSELFLKLLLGIKGTELEQSIMMLPLSYIQLLVPALSSVLNNYPLATEVGLRALHALTKFHLHSLRGSDKEKLQVVAELAERRGKEMRQVVGFNLAGLRFIKGIVEEDRLSEEFAELNLERKRKRKQRDKSIKRAMLNLV